VSGIRWHDRVFVAGSTGSGKSELLNYLFSGLRNQKLLLDTKPEFHIEGVPPVSRPGDIDWDAPIIHYRDLAARLEDYDEIFYEAHHRRNFTICCHEFADLCADEPSRTPEWVRKSLRKGNIFGNGLFGGTQRPVGMPRQTRTEAQHVIHLVPPLDPEDEKVVAKMMGGLSIHELARQLEEARHASPDPEGRFAALWYDRRARATRILPPLPDHVRAQIIVRRTVDLDSSTPTHEDETESQKRGSPRSWVGRTRSPATP
jgi:hypothetical protein